MKKLDELDINVKGYKGFKDDTNIILNPVGRNVKYREGQLVMKNIEEVEKESQLEIDEVSMKIVKDVADSIEHMIDTEVDFPSNKKNVGNKMPILDIVFWIKKDSN